MRTSCQSTIVAFIFLTFSGFSSDVRAQLPDSLSAETQVSLLTIYPGDPIYSAFGHSTYRFTDPKFGYDIVFNYGTFEYWDPYFVPKFIYGKLNYFLSFGQMDSLMRGAEIEQRSVVEQHLLLSQEQVFTLYQTLRIKAQPENRTYRYDFLFENCSTILLDRIQDLGNAQVRLDTTAATTDTFRELLQPYLNHRTLYDLGIAIVLGSTLDEPATYEERSFLPLELMSAFDQAVVRVTATAGEPTPSAPLVSATDTLFWVSETGFKDHRDLTLLWVFAAIALFWIGVNVQHFRSNINRSAHQSQRIETICKFGIADRVLFGVAGFAGLIISFVWFISEHTVGAANWNILWAVPTHILPALFYNRFPTKWRKWYFIVSAVAAFGLIALQPILVQILHPALYPIVILLGWRSIAVSIRYRSRENATA